MDSQILSILPLIFSVLAIIISIFTWKSNMRSSRYAQHYNLVTEADKMFAENKDILRFHGINPNEIEEKFGVTPNELSYLLQSFNSGSISNLLSTGSILNLFSKKRRRKPFVKDSYWYNILKNEPTQKAFPLIEKLFDSNNIYITKCKNTISLIKKTH